MTDITMIALSKLVPGRRNVRKTKPAMSIPELAASIHAHGLLQNLVVAETENGRYSVEAGGRRLKALRKLAKAKAIPGNMPIPCAIKTLEEAAEASLAENVQREAMHPADEIEAFEGLVREGHGPEAIAARFGVTPQVVARRLRVARVSPRLIEAFRKDELDLDQLSALAFSDDHAAQEAAFFSAPEWARTPEKLRAQLAHAHVLETDKLARFVGVEAYEAAGGALVSDLLVEEGDPRWLSDRDLLVRLVNEKLEPIVAEVRGEGWAFVEISMDGIQWTQFPERVRERRRELTAEEQAEHEHLLAKLDEETDEAEIEKIEEAIDALAASGWQADEVALAGAIVTLGHDGAPKIERGLVKTEQVKALKALRRKHAKSESNSTDSDDDNADANAAAPAARPRLPAKFVDELLAHKTLGLRVAITSKPDLALRLVAFTLAVPVVNLHAASCLDIVVREENVAKSITRSESEAPNASGAILDGLRRRLPSDPMTLWQFVSEADHGTLLEIIAIAIAPGIDLRRNGPWSGMDVRMSLGDALCEAAGLDMSAWWTASPQSYFEHVRKDVIVDAMKEVNPALDRGKLDKMSKKEVLTRAKKLFKGGGWLPEQFRSVAAAAPAPAPEAIAAE